MCPFQSVVREMRSTLILGRLLSKLLKTRERNCVVAKQKELKCVLFLWSLVYKTVKGREWNWKYNSSLKTKVCKDLYDMAGLWQQQIGPDYPGWSSYPKFPQKRRFWLATMAPKGPILFYLNTLAQFLGTHQKDQYLVQGLLFLSSLAYCWLGSTQYSLQIRFAFCIWGKKKKIKHTKKFSLQLHIFAAKKYTSLPVAIFWMLKCCFSL